MQIDDDCKKHPKVVTLKFKTVMLGILSSPFLLNGTIHHHIYQYQFVDSQFALKFIRSIYGDDLVSGASTVEDVVKLYSKSKAQIR